MNIRENNEKQSKIVQKFLLETEINKVGNKKYIFMEKVDKNLDKYTEMIKK